MKKFYLCKLCLIVFGALLATHGVNAAEKVDQSGEFECEIVSNSWQEFVSGRVVNGQDSEVLGTSLFIRYSVFRRDEKERRSGWDTHWVDFLAEGNGIGSEGFFTKFSANDLLNLSFENDGEIFSASHAGKFLVTLKRIYKEDWLGFATRHFSLDEGISFTSGLRCKRSNIVGK